MRVFNDGGAGGGATLRLREGGERWKRGAEQILSVSCLFWSRSTSSTLLDALRNMAGSWPRSTTSRLPRARKRPKHTGASEFAFACWFFGLPFDVDKSKRFGTTPPPSHKDRAVLGLCATTAATTTATATTMATTEVWRSHVYNMFDEFEGSRCGRLLVQKRRLGPY